MNCNFKIGDKVRCIDNTKFEGRLFCNLIYTISFCNSDFLILAEDEDEYLYYYNRFELDIKATRKEKLNNIIKNGHKI